MIFSDRQIRQALEQGRVIIDPLPADDQFAPSAVDLHVGDEFRIWKPPAMIGAAAMRLSEVNLPAMDEFMADLKPDPSGNIVIPPGQFVLSRTLERIELPLDSRLAARVEGRSSFARLGLVVHMTAPTIHAGFAGNVVLEIMNFGPFPLQIDPNRTRVCQVIFEELGDQPTIAINTVFQDQNNVLGKKQKEAMD